MCFIPNTLLDDVDTKTLLRILIYLVSIISILGAQGKKNLSFVIRNMRSGIFMEYKIRKIRARKSDSEIELEFETSVTLKEAEEVANSALDRLLAISSPSSTPATQTIPTAGASETYPSISKPDNCSDAITKLLSTEWGKTPRTMGELKDAMTFNAAYYPEGTFKSTFTRMTKDGKLRRVRKGDVFAYILP